MIVAGVTSKPAIAYTPIVKMMSWITATIAATDILNSKRTAR